MCTDEALISKNLQTCMYIIYVDNIHVYVARIFTYVYIYIHAYVFYIYIYTYIDMRMYIHIYIYILFLFIFFGVVFMCAYINMYIL